MHVFFLFVCDRYDSILDMNSAQMSREVSVALFIRLSTPLPCFVKKHFMQGLASGAGGVTVWLDTFVNLKKTWKYRNTRQVFVFSTDGHNARPCSAFFF